MHREFSRTERLGQLLQRELAALLREEVKDPRVAGVTLLEVQVSRDLAHATVYFSALGDAGHRELERALAGAAGFLRRELGRRLTLRGVPALRFRYDATEERAMALSSLIDEAVARDRGRED